MKLPRERFEYSAIADRKRLKLILDRYPGVKAQ